MATTEVSVSSLAAFCAHFSRMQGFESTLKEVVNAKRLSASKMATLTEIALKCMEVRHSTQLKSLI